MKYIETKLKQHKDNQQIAWVTINNFKAKNALNDQVIEELLISLRELEFNKAVKVIILKGEGEAFSAGGDIKMMRKREGMFAGDAFELKQNYQNQIQQIPLFIEQMETLLIAQIHGPAIGAGLDLACMCDFRFATPESYFAESFVKIGLIPGIGGSFFLMRLVGYAKALELTLTGRRFEVEEAKTIGVINQIFDKSEIENKVLEYCKQLLENSSMAMELAKKSLKYAYRHDHRVILDLLSSYQGICQTQDDHLKRLS